MTIKMYMTPNVEKLTRLVEKSRGNVLLRLSDNSLCNLKNEEAAAALLTQEADKCHGVEIHLSDTKDYVKFINFMLEDCA